MKIRCIQSIFIGLLLYNSNYTIFPIKTKADDAQTKVNVANNIAGLNIKKPVIMSVNNNDIITYYIEIAAANSSKILYPLRFMTGLTDVNRSTVDIFYNKDKGLDPWNNELDQDTLYFSNHHGGNNYKFVGNVGVTGTLSAASIVVNGKSVESAVDKANNALLSTYQLQSPYNNASNSPLLIMDNGVLGFDNQNIRRNTLMLGGETQNSVVGLKASCQNTSGGDLGGSCYQFVDMSGMQGWNRSGSGATDGVNVDIRSSNSSPLDVIGGNKLVKDGDGDHDYSVQGNDYTIIADVNAGSNVFTLQGSFGCGVALKDVAGCKMTGTDFLDQNGKIVTSVKVLPGVYNSLKDTTVVNLAYGYKLKSNLKASSQVRITFYSADGQAYGVKPIQNGAEIYPALSNEEKNLIQPRMALWTNIADGMLTTENKKDIYDAVDMPNYYYGYYSGYTGKISENKKHTYSQLNVETYYYPGPDNKGLWRTLNTSGLQDGSVGIPGKNKGDQLDYKLTYIEPGTTDRKYNSNFHQYTQPALFLGLSNKNFNTYMLQVNDSSKLDSITRTYDNEWDYWMRSNKPYSLNSHGLTMTWGGSNYRLTSGSYMLWLAGFNVMPTGLKVDGVWEDGGKLIDTDSGFRVYKWAWPSQEMNTLNGKQVMVALGQAKTNGSSYQLFSYMSNDGSANNSLHFGMTKSVQSLQYNFSPTCNNDGQCSVLGQVIFDPLGYVGGIALGAGQGDKTRLGLIVDNNNNVIVNNQLTVNGKSVNNIVDNAIVKSQINVSNGIVGLNVLGEVTANISSQQVYTPFMLLPNTGSIRFYTGSSDSNNADVNLYYNKDSNIDPWGNHLEANTFYFTNHHDGNNYKFVGNLITTGNITSDSMNVNKSLTLDSKATLIVNGVSMFNYIATNKLEAKDHLSAPKIIGTNFQGQLSTPSSSIAPCNAGEFKDDANYHYVCVATNKWKRVALSNF